MEERGMTETPTPEIIVGEIDKSARETIRIALSAYEGTPTVSIWRWCRDALWRSASRQGTKLDTLVGADPGVAIDHRALNLDREAHGVDHAPELDDRPIAMRLTIRPW
jgi:hypothetical protein